MTIEEKVKNMISMAPYGSEEKNCLRVVLGELTIKKGQNSETVVKELIRSNEDSMRRCRRDPHELMRIEVENKVLKSLLEG